MDPSLVMSVVAASLTAVMGALTSFIARRYQQAEEASRDEVGDIAAAVRAAADQARAQSQAAIAKQLPHLSGAELGQFLVQLRNAGSLGSGGDGEAEGRRPVLDPWSVVEGLVNEYHKQALDQARVQFWFSVVAASVGFVWVLGTATWGLSQDLPTTDLVIRTIPGLIVDLVAALFFKQAQSTRERATSLYDRLRKDIKAKQALELLGTIELPTVRSFARAQIALHMAGVESSGSDQTSLMKAMGLDAPDPVGDGDSKAGKEMAGARADPIRSE